MLRDVVVCRGVVMGSHRNSGESKMCRSGFRWRGGRATACLWGWLIIIMVASGCSGAHPSNDPRVPGGIPLPVEHGEVPLHEQDVRRLVRSPSGDALATISADAVHIWALPEMTLLGEITDIDYLEFAGDVVLSDGGARLALVNEYHEMHVWDRASQTVQRVSPWRGRSVKRLIGETPTGALLWVSTDDVLVRWDVGGGDPVSDAVALDFVGQVQGVVALRDGGFLLWGARPRRIHFDPDFGVRVERVERFAFQEPNVLLPTSSGSGEALIFLDGGVPFVADLEAHETRLLVPRSPRAIDGEEDRPRVVCVSPGGEWVAVAFSSGAFEVWDMGAERQAVGGRVGRELVREVYPRAVYDAVLGREFLWLLLPEQRVVRYRIADGTREGIWDL